MRSINPSSPVPLRLRFLATLAILFISGSIQAEGFLIFDNHESANQPGGLYKASTEGIQQIKTTYKNTYADRWQYATTFLVNILSENAEYTQVRLTSFADDQTTTVPHAPDDGLKILRNLITYLPNEKQLVFGEVHRNGQQRIFTLELANPTKYNYLVHFDKVRQTAEFEDMTTSGAHIYLTRTKAKKNQMYESHFTGSMDNFDFILNYCESLSCQPVALTTSPGIFDARLTDNGKRVVYLAPAGVIGNTKGYRLQVVDLDTKQVRTVASLTYPFKNERGSYNMGHPKLHVFKGSPFVMYSPNANDNYQLTKTWTIINIITGETTKYNLPDGAAFIYYLPISNRTDTLRADSDSIHPYMTIQKFVSYNKDTRESTHTIEVVDLTTGQPVFSFPYTGAGISSAIYLPEGEFPKSIGD